MNMPGDWTTLPLEGAGRSLVEASAGTGKTWTIAVLYLRLLLEEKFSPRQIIVSTFTNAAAAELGERLRGKLLWALTEAAKHRDGIVSETGKHPDRDWICKRWREAPPVLEADVQRLQAALADLDAAPISTLHALCSRILADHPFAAGALFRAGEMIDGKALEAALVADLWRVIAQGGASDELVRLARAADIDRNTLKKYVPVLLQANVEVGGLEPATLRSRLGFLGDLDAWASKVRGLLDDDGWFHKRSALRQTWRNLVDTLVPVPGVVPGEIDLAKLRAAKALTAISKAGIANPDIQALANVSEEIAAAVPEMEWDRAGSVPLRQFLAAAQRWCLAAMQARLEAANQSTFDQLLLKVRTALQPRDGQRALADALFAAWPVALVDEFQDTDPVQFGILDAIYTDDENAPRGRLVMIGDPKQAIYRFRGGDVQAYERAKAAVPEADRLTLGTNHRSSRGYVEAINQFYETTGSKLGPATSQTTIEYAPVQASGRRDGEPLRSAVDHAPIARPLVLHRLAPDDDAPDLETHALRICAGQIVQALSAVGYCIGNKRLEPGDIAVLLPSHAQIAKLATMLKARGVPCVTGSQKSVFETDVARELRLVLHAALHPDDPRTLRAALATRLCGVSLGSLQALRHDAVAWDVHASRFHTLRALLERGGPLALVAALLEQHAARLLDTVEGERMLTDLRHLGELLQEAWVDCGSGERLLAWLADQMADGAEGSDAADARALRLESDAARVKLMTLHASKGLEFGVVFLPLMWKHGPHNKGARLLASEDGASKYLVEGPAKELVKQQEYEERFRILYVALTRAIHACHVFVLPSEILTKQQRLEVALNALDFSNLHSNTDADCIDVIEGWNAYPDATWRGETGSDAVRNARALPAAPAGPLPMRHSFTTLSGGGRQRVAEEGGAAEDEVLLEQVAVQDAELASATRLQDTPATFHSQLDALAAVAGADFGNAVHALFEHRVPGQPFAPDAVLAALREHGVRPRAGNIDTLAAPLAQRLQAVLDTPLGSATGPRLADLAAADMRAELEFNYLLDGASLRALRNACEANGEAGLAPVREQTLAGLMNGKIDLVFAHDGRFHVLDYKGNQLASGPRSCLQDYAPAALEHKMLATGYRFQALLYTIAVERYLRERLGDRYRRAAHLGDCWYLFIRAVGLQLPDGTPCGIWHHRFRDDLLDAVQGVLGLNLQEAA
ncbi:MAG: UvrD-helicase domain-containing protein [Xanthomonadaceae bacterium]|nr:UvrD-helicase domain-containing protein [Xanthomonadaceae bacterium]